MPKPRPLALFLALAAVPLVGGLFALSAARSSGGPADAICAAAFLIVGPLALWRSPGYLRARLLAVLCVAVAIEMALPIYGDQGAVRQVAVLAAYLITGLQLGLELHLASVFPEKQGWLDRAPWVLPLYYLAGLGMAGIVCGTTLAEARSIRLPWSPGQAADIFNGVLLPAWALAVPSLLGVQALRHPEPEGRREAALLLAGSLPWTATIAILTVLSRMEAPIPDWAGVAESYAVFCYPVAILIVLLREASAQGRIVLGLASEVQKLGSLAEISSLVEDRLRSVFHPDRVCLVEPASHSYPPEGELFRVLERHGKPLEYPLDLEPAVSLAEKAWLDQNGIRLAVPSMSGSGGSGRVSGALLLGGKKSGEPYTEQDRRILSAVGGQIALVRDNARLQQVQREVLSRLEPQGLRLVRECPRCGHCAEAEEATCPRDGTELTLSLPIERLIAGRYRLDRRIGRGGMGVVYEGRDEHLGRPVAIKVLLPASFGDSEALHRFEREARVCARLHHPNIVAVHDYGTTETGGAFLVMELLRGRSLRVALDRGAPLDPQVAARWFGEILAGVGAAHESHVIHRDLKPENLFVARTDARSEVVKVLDFGLAKALPLGNPVEASSMTVPGTLLGTLSYMAPEQLSGGRPDERSDLFSLGIIAFEAVTGRHPFPGSNAAEVIQAILRAEPHIPGVTPEARRVDAVLRRCLAKAPRHRHASVAELAADLIPALHACQPLGRTIAAVSPDGETRRLTGGYGPSSLAD